MSGESVRVVLCDDQPVIRDVLRKVIDALPGLVVQDEAESGPDLLETLRAKPADMVILDVKLPGGGPVLAGLLRQQHPLLTIVVFSADDDSHLQQAMLEAGAVAYIVKTGRLAPLRTALLHHATGAAG